MILLKKIRENLISLLAWISGLSAFLVLAAIILLASLIVDLKHIDRMIKSSCRIIMRMLFIRVKVEGRHLLDPSRTYLFMSNHVNLFDVFILYGYIPHFCRAVELDKHFTWPIYGTIIRRLGMIPISHTRARGALKSLERAKKKLESGISMIILPEGHRTRDGKIGSLMRGSFLLAKQAGADIEPLVMVGARQINHKGSLLIRPGKMTLRFGEPISYQDIRTLEIDEIKSYVHDRMSKLFHD